MGCSRITYLNLMKTKGISQSLGKLEREIMEIVWQLETASVRQVLVKLREKRPIAYTTVMTIMVRLASKNLLKRQLNEQGAYVYQPVCDKQQYCELVSKNAITGLIKTYGEIAIAQFVDAIESSSTKELADWRLKLKKIR